MAQKPKKPPYSWFRWQMRPRIYDEEQFAAKKGTKNVSVEDEKEKNNSTEISQGESSKENSILNKGNEENEENREGLEETLDENGKEQGKKEKIELEKGDLFAMIMSAMLTIFPVCVGLLLLIVLLAYFLFFH